MLMSFRGRKVGVSVSLLVLFVVGGMRVRLVEADGGEEAECLRQIGSSVELSQCMDYLVYGHQGPPELFRAGHNSEVLDQCCAQLGEVKQECRCEAIRQMLEQEEKHIEREKVDGVVRRARNLPAMCSLEPHRCDLQVYGL